jgi:hypothetical protein
MPFRLEVSASEGFVRAVATGRVEVKDISDHIVRVRQAGANRFPELIDATRADSVTFTMRDLLSLARLAFGEFGNASVAPRAVLVASRKHFEWARIFASLVAGWMPVGVFTERREAMLWLEHRAQASAEPVYGREAVG